jgi:hypothetical protein
MDVENLIDIFKVEVLKNRPNLNDFTKGSVLYTLARSIGVVVNEVYVEIEKLRKASILLDSSESLDEELLKSISPSLEKTNGKTATGYVLISNLDSNIVTLPVNTVLTDPISLSQYITTTIITISSLLEVQVPIVSVGVGEEYNIPAGRNLINVSYPRLVFTVGEYRDLDNTVVGDITGGESEETKEDYYTRIKNTLFSQRITQKQVLIDYLVSHETYDIDSVTLETIAGGLLLVWINSPTTTYTVVELDQINSEIQDFIPVGVISQVLQLTKRPISVNIQVFEETTEVIDEAIKNVVRKYVDSINPSGSFSTIALRNLISVELGIVVKILLPTSNIDLSQTEKLQLTSTEIINVT